MTDPSPRPAALTAVRRTVREFRTNELTDRAAALTYYSVLAVFPALLALVSVIGLLGSSATDALLSNAEGLAPGPARDILTKALTELEQRQQTAGLLLFVSLALAIWAASSYVAAFMRAANGLYGVQETRPFWRTLPTRVLTTLGLLLMFAAVAVGVTFTGSLAQGAGDVFGLNTSALDVWEVVKWPVILATVTVMLAFLYWIAPNVDHRFRLLSPGAVVGVLLSILASVGFAFYVSNFGSYNKTYGALAGVIVFLVWLWIVNVAVLLGALLNAELERDSLAIPAGSSTG